MGQGIKATPKVHGAVGLERKREENRLFIAHTIGNKKTKNKNPSRETMSDTGVQFAPLQNICEFLNALHVYSEEARHNITRYVEATHFCSHVRPGVRQCLIYDSPNKDARLIGVEYMITKENYDKLPDDEKRLWHSHDFEVKSGMLFLPRPENADHQEWEKAETEAMKEIVGLYGKTWHFWQIDRGDELPVGYPTLMGSLTEENQVDLDSALRERNARFNVDHHQKAKQREGIKKPEIDPLANYWWKERR